MTEQEFHERIKDCIDGAYQVTEHLNPSKTEGTTGNGQLTTGLYHAIIYFMRFYHDYRIELMLDVGLNDARMAPLCYAKSKFKRNPEDHQSHDNYVGLMATLYFYFPEIARKMARFHRNSNWRLCGPDVGRLPWHRWFYEACGGFPMNWFKRWVERCVWYWDARSPVGRADGRMQVFIRGVVLSRKYPDMERAFERWQREVIKRHGSIGESWAAYLPKGHPMREVFKNEG